MSPPGLLRACCIILLALPWLPSAGGYAYLHVKSCSDPPTRHQYPDASAHANMELASAADDLRFSVLDQSTGALVALFAPGGTYTVTVRQKRRGHMAITASHGRLRWVDEPLDRKRQEVCHGRMLTLDHDRSEAAFEWLAPPRGESVPENGVLLTATTSTGHHRRLTYATLSLPSHVPAALVGPVRLTVTLQGWAAPVDQNAPLAATVAASLVAGAARVSGAPTASISASWEAGKDTVDVSVPPPRDQSDPQWQHFLSQLFLDGPDDLLREWYGAEDLGGGAVVSELYVHPLPVPQAGDVEFRHAWERPVAWQLAAVLPSMLLLLAGGYHATRVCGGRTRRWVSRRPLPAVAWLGVTDLTVDQAAALGLYAAAVGTVGLLVREAPWVVIAGCVTSFMMASAMLPAMRFSPWVGLLGIPFDRAVRFHRWAGTAAVAALLLHAVIAVVKAGIVDIARTLTHFDITSGFYAADVGLGVIAGALVSIAASLSLPQIRRRWYEVFKSAHYLMLPAVALTIMHAPMTLPLTTPALAAWLLDRTLRAASSRRPLRMTRVSALPAAATDLRVVLPPRHRLTRTKPGQFVVACLPGLPGVQAWQWHPLTVASAPGSPELRLIVQAAGARQWSRALHDAVVDGVLTAGSAIHLEGPYGSPSGDLGDHSVVVLLAGGVGVTPMLSLAEAWLASQAAQDVGADARTKEAARGPHMHFVWCSRSGAALRGWAPDVLQQLAEHPCCTLHLHHTSGQRAGGGGEGEELVGLMQGDSSDGASKAVSEDSALLRHVRSQEDLEKQEMGSARRFAADVGCIHEERPDLANLLHPRELLRSIARPDAANVGVYVCGPTALVTDATSIARRHGYRLHRESFLW